jgi:hypothetical protein
MPRVESAAACDTRKQASFSRAVGRSDRRAEVVLFGWRLASPSTVERNYYVAKLQSQVLNKSDAPSSPFENGHCSDAKKKPSGEGELDAFAESWIRERLSLFCCKVVAETRGIVK